MTKRNFALLKNQYDRYKSGQKGHASLSRQIIF